MNRQILINKTINNISMLPDWRLKELSDYIDFLLYRTDEKELIKDIMSLSSSSESLSFLNDEDDIYDETDLIEKFQ